MVIDREHLSWTAEWEFWKKIGPSTMYDMLEIIIGGARILNSNTSCDNGAETKLRIWSARAERNISSPILVPAYALAMQLLMHERKAPRERHYKYSPVMPPYWWWCILGHFKVIVRALSLGCTGKKCVSGGAGRGRSRWLFIAQLSRKFDGSICRFSKVVAGWRREIA